MIYNDVKRYAETVKITEEKAEIICRYFLDLYRLQYELSKCPKCGEYTLTIDSGEFDELTHTTLYNAYVLCTNDKVLVSEEILGESGKVVIETYEDDCEFESDDLEKYGLLNHWVDFDELLYTTYLEMSEEDRNGIADRLILLLEKELKVRTDK